MIGVDEVGRGAWAGPLLVVAARQSGTLPDGLTDSKLISTKKRQLLALQIKRQCHIGEGWVTSDEIDELGLGPALKLATERALKLIKAKPSEVIIVDGKVDFSGEEFVNSTTKVQADKYEPIVSAASIVAKVMRDAVMRQIAKDHPQYSFETNAGYGTKQHAGALVKFGAVEGLHRFSYAPVRRLAC